jgi:hypothetical protein
VPIFEGCSQYLPMRLRLFLKRPFMHLVAHPMTHEDAFI